MQIARPLLLAAALGLLAGCADLGLSRGSPPPRPTAVALPPTKSDVWQQVANAPDVDRLRRLPMAWSEGLAEARAGRFGVAIREEGDLLRPGAALARPAPTPGSYNCRLVRLGKSAPRAPALVRFKPFFCYVDVEGELLTVVKQTGTERPAGRLWEDDTTTRLIFLGTLALGEREAAKAYGADAKRDMAGVFERIGPMRFRLVLPYSITGSKVDVYEMTPVAEQPQG